MIYRKIATLGELKDVLGTNVNMTVFRKLKELSYLSSYSHGGRYYTLDQIAQFDENGLWCYLSVCFSRYGSLLSTLKNLVTQSVSGYFATELENMLYVKVKESLLRLVRKGIIAREQIAGQYLYYSSETSVAKQQILNRRMNLSGEEVFSEEVKAAINFFLAHLTSSNVVFLPVLKL